MYLLTNFSGSIPDPSFKKPTHVSYQPEDPLINEGDVVRFTKCVEDGIKKGLIIIMTKSHGFRYVIDDGIVFGGRFSRESGNYWVFIHENEFISSGILNEDGSPGAFTYVFEGQFPGVVKSMDESDIKRIRYCIRFDIDSPYIQLDFLINSAKVKDKDGTEYGIIESIGLAIPKIISPDNYTDTKPWNENKLRDTRDIMEKTIEKDLLECGRPIDRDYVLREAAAITQNNIRVSSGLKFPDDFPTRASSNVNDKGFRWGFSRRYHNSSSPSSSEDNSKLFQLSWNELKDKTKETVEEKPKKPIEYIPEAVYDKTYDSINEDVVGINEDIPEMVYDKTYDCINDSINEDIAEINEDIAESNNTDQIRDTSQFDDFFNLLFPTNSASPVPASPAVSVEFASTFGPSYTMDPSDEKGVFDLQPASPASVVFDLQPASPAGPASLVPVETAVGPEPVLNLNDTAEPDSNGDDGDDDNDNESDDESFVVKSKSLIDKELASIIIERINKRQKPKLSNRYLYILHICNILEEVKRKEKVTDEILHSLQLKLEKSTILFDEKSIKVERLPCL